MACPDQSLDLILAREGNKYIKQGNGHPGRISRLWKSGRWDHLSRPEVRSGAKQR